MLPFSAAVSHFLQPHMIAAHTVLTLFVPLQLSGGGLVPLSHAICCRLCMPDELPPTQARISEDDKAVAIMSMGCHASSGSGPFALQCEPRGNSIVTGGLPNLPSSGAGPLQLMTASLRVRCMAPSTDRSRTFSVSLT